MSATRRVHPISHCNFSLASFGARTHARATNHTLRLNSWIRAEQFALRQKATRRHRHHRPNPPLLTRSLALSLVHLASSLASACSHSATHSILLQQQEQHLKSPRSRADHFSASFPCPLSTCVSSLSPPPPVKTVCSKRACAAATAWATCYASYWQSGKP